MNTNTMRTPFTGLGMDRRVFFARAATVLAATPFAPWALAEDRPAVTDPRATSGDTAHEPDWKERLTITVGPKKADLVGETNKAIQAGVDYVARLGGGTVHVLPGVYRMRNAVFLRPRVRLLGSGTDSVLLKNPSHGTKLAADSDWFDREITLADAQGFELGDGVCLRTKNPHHGGMDVLKRTLVARSGNRFKLDRALRKNFWRMGDPTVASLFPLLTAEKATDVVIENITLDGNRANNENFNGNYGGCIFMQDCARFTIRRVITRNYNGDGISWQICHDVFVENCHSHGNANYGLHPGSGSQRPVIRDNQLKRNGIGLYWCWGVRHGLAERNKINQSLRYGISIGHHDTDNLIRDNQITRSGKIGVLFRPGPGKAFAPHRNRLENNRIIDSGPDDGIGVDVRGEIESVTLRGNHIRETRKPANRIGIRLGAKTQNIKLIDNRIEGFSVAVEDLRKP